jgi:hypothetical protein
MFWIKLSRLLPIFFSGQNLFTIDNFYDALIRKRNCTAPITRWLKFTRWRQLNLKIHSNEQDIIKVIFTVFLLSTLASCEIIWINILWIVRLMLHFTALKVN